MRPPSCRCGAATRKAPTVGVLDEEEEDMRLITNIELTGRNESELRALFGSVTKAVSQTERGSAERRNGLASLENIGRALMQQRATATP